MHSSLYLHVHVQVEVEPKLERVLIGTSPRSWSIYCFPYGPAELVVSLPYLTPGGLRQSPCRVLARRGKELVLHLLLLLVLATLFEGAVGVTGRWGLVDLDFGLRRATAGGVLRMCFVLGHDGRETRKLLR